MAASVEIQESDSITFREFEDGNSVQVRITIPTGHADAYKKGQKIKVTHLGNEFDGKIVSEPLTIEGINADKEKILSLIVEKF